MNSTKYESKNMCITWSQTQDTTADTSWHCLLLQSFLCLPVLADLTIWDHFASCSLSVHFLSSSWDSLMIWDGMSTGKELTIFLMLERVEASSMWLSCKRYRMWCNTEKDENRVMGDMGTAIKIFSQNFF